MKMVVMGTRPEIIKLYPVIKELKDAYVVLTGQHDELAKQMITDLGIKVDENLKVMKRGQSLSELTIKLHQKLSALYKKMSPDLVVVQGDTTSAMVAALEAFYLKIPVAHVEAGLRTDDIYAPFPEEVNRRIITQLATYHFAPTDDAAMTVFSHSHKNTYVQKVGQTGIDTLLEFAPEGLERKNKILVTLHRRENLDKIPEVLRKINDFLFENEEWEAIMPTHPHVRKIVEELEPAMTIRIVDPLGYFDMIREMREARLIVTDSGGIQEEAAALRTPVLVARESTERFEGIQEGFAKLLGEKIELFDVPDKMNPYGDGEAGRRIAECLNV